MHPESDMYGEAAPQSLLNSLLVRSYLPFICPLRIYGNGGLRIFIQVNEWPLAREDEQLLGAHDDCDDREEHACIEGTNNRSACLAIATIIGYSQYLEIHCIVMNASMMDL